MITFAGLGDGVDLVTLGTGSVLYTAVRSVGVDAAFRQQTDARLCTFIHICVSKTTKNSENTQSKQDILSYENEVKVNIKYLYITLKNGNE